MSKNRIKLRNLGIWFADQLRHPSSLLRRKTWGVFSEYAHVRRSDRRPKMASSSREKALEVADFMARKYGGSYSVYKCLYCDGWHVANDQKRTIPQSGKKNKSSTETLDVSNEAASTLTQPVDSSALDMDRLLKLDIPDISSVYGGIRGRTMSSRHQDYAWPIIKECGIRTIIDLREDGIYTRLGDLCTEYGMDYFHYPVDNKTTNIGTMVRLFPELCRKIDAGHFYIACAMGLHRTDIALCCYWIFHAADREVPPPEIRGYRKDTGHNIDKILRVFNAYYKTYYEMYGKYPLDADTFMRRKKIIEKQWLTTGK